MLEKRKVFLVSPKLPSGTSKNVASESQENLGLGYLASFLEREGDSTKIFDLNHGGNNSEDVLLEEFNKNLPLLVGFSIHSLNDLNESKKIALRLRQYNSEIPLVVGGHYVSKHVEQCLEENTPFNFFICGEGEFKLRELYNHLSSYRSKDYSNPEIKQVFQLNDEKFLIDLDAIPFPKRYALKEILKFKEGSASMLTSRGCPGGCSFCTAPLNKKWRMRSSPNVIEEIKELSSAGIKRITFQDDNYLGNLEGQKRAKEIALSLINEGTPIRYEFSARIDGIDKELLNLFYKSGLSKIRVGVESFNQRQLDLYNKRTTPSKIISNMEEIIRSGITPHFSFIAFDPYVSLEEVQNNLNYMKRFSNFIHFRYVTSLLSPEEGSRIWDKLAQDDLLLKDGEKYTFRFLDENVQNLWTQLELIRKERLSGLEDKVRDLSKEVHLFSSEVDNFYFEGYLSKVSHINKEITSIWLDVLQNSLDSIKDKSFIQTKLELSENINCKINNLKEYISNFEQEHFKEGYKES